MQPVMRYVTIDVRIGNVNYTCKAIWKVLCGPESVNTLTWQFQRDRIHVDPNYTDGLVQVVSTCGKQCDGCNMEVVDLSRLIRGLQFIPLDQAIA